MFYNMLTLKKFLKTKKRLQDEKKNKVISAIIKEVEDHMKYCTGYAVGVSYYEKEDLEEAINILNKKYKFLKFEVINYGNQNGTLYKIDYEVRQ